MAREAQKAGEATLEVDSLNEVVILSAACVSQELRRALLPRIPPDHFQDPKNSAAWSALRELERKQLDFDVATLSTLAAGVDAAYVQQVIDLRPEPPANLEHHVQNLMWDRARVTAWTGPLQALVTAMRDPRTEPDKVRALARQVSMSFDGYGDRGLLLEPQKLIRDQMENLRQRRQGGGQYPYGIKALDDLVDGRTGKPMLVTRAMPGKQTWLTGLSGSGKSTFGLQFILGQVRMKKRIVAGAWEPEAGEMLEELACLSMKLSRTDLLLGKVSDDEEEQIHEREKLISRYVRFLPNPFRMKRGARTSNDLNLDLIEGYLADSGCDVFYADLWERCLEEDRPQDEKNALYRQQEMLDRLRIHGIFLHQQNLKKVEDREDKRPTREAMKGAGTYVEVADTLFGTHRQALFKAVPDDKFELLILKQRKGGRWPVALEFDWNPDTGQVWGGVEVDFDSKEDAPGGAMEAFIQGPKERKKGGWRG